MTKITICAGLTAAVVLAGAPDARAQGQTGPGRRGFINVNVGAQPQQRTIATSQTFPLYDEVATVGSTQPVENGAIFDVSGGYRLARHFALAVEFSIFPGRVSASTVAASIPDPLFVDRPRTVTDTAPGLTHNERGVHVQAVWYLPVTDRIDVALSAGPSFIRVTQQLTTSVTVPAGTQNISITRETETGTAFGVNVGVDGSYLLTPRYGVGLFIQYAGGSVDLPTVSSLQVGGLRTGLGFRVRL